MILCNVSVVSDAMGQIYVKVMGAKLGIISFNSISIVPLTATAT